MILTALAFSSWILVFALLLVLAINDIRYYLLPNVLTASLALVAFSFHSATGWSLLTINESFFGAMLGGGLLLSLRAVANYITKKDALGLGDVKLITASGLLLGFPGIFLALAVGSLAGLFHGLALQFREMKVTGTKPPLATINVPAGVGLALGISLVTLYQFGFWWQE